MSPTPPPLGRLFDPDGIHRAADISEDGRYRYLLRRRWHPTDPPIWWVMLNPSTADGHVDDQTIRRVMAFSNRWGAGAALVLNLFALRTANPAVLFAEPDPTGPRNDEYLAQIRLGHAQAAARYHITPLVVCAWGSLAPPDRVREVACGLLRGLDLHCLGRVSNGQPRHPLYVHGTTPPQPWSTP